MWSDRAGTDPMSSELLALCCVVFRNGYLGVSPSWS